MPEGKLPASDSRADLSGIRALARLLDTAFRIPGTGIRIGLDPLIGVIPGIGDIAGLLLSAAILFSAARLGVPAATLLRMAANVGLDAIVGMVPLAGDLFDVGWKANQRNVRLVEAHLSDPGQSSRSARRWLIATAAGLGVVLVALVGGAAWLTVQLLQALGFG